MCCFPPSQKVLTTRGYIPVSALKPTDQLIALQPNRRNQLILKETPLYTFLHFDPELSGEYLTLKCDNGSEIILSLEHLVFRWTKDGGVVGVAAKEIRIGDRLVHLDKNKKISHPSVVEIGEKEVIQGAYTPLSQSGTLIVGGIMASCYAHLGSFTHRQAHGGLAPLRFWHRTGRKTGHLMKSGSNTTGIHPFAKFLMGVTGTQVTY